MALNPKVKPPRLFQRFAGCRRFSRGAESWSRRRPRGRPPRRTPETPRFESHCRRRRRSGSRRGHSKSPCQQRTAVETSPIRGPCGQTYTRQYVSRVSVDKITYHEGQKFLTLPTKCYRYFIEILSIIGINRTAGSKAVRLVPDFECGKSCFSACLLNQFRPGVNIQGYSKLKFGGERNFQSSWCLIMNSGASGT